MSELPAATVQPRSLRWTQMLVLYLRGLALLSIAKGLFHWGMILGIADGDGSTFEWSPIAWQSATVYFAVIDLIAGVGLWLAAAWGGVVWLTSAISLAAIQLFFPNVYGGQYWPVFICFALIMIYLALAYLSARERPD